MQNITVRFANETPLTVAFYLNGGGGLETNLESGAEQSYSMVVDPGVQPAVGIHQPTGETLSFSVEDHGDYAFRFKDGKIENFYKV
jgi:hypothetical protein